MAKSEFQKKLDRWEKQYKRLTGEFDDKFISEHAEEMSKGLSPELINLWERELNSFLYEKWKERQEKKNNGKR